MPAPSFKFKDVDFDVGDEIFLSDLIDYVPPVNYKWDVESVSILIYELDGAEFIDANSVDVTFYEKKGYHFLFTEDPPEPYGWDSTPHNLFEDGKLLITEEDFSFNFTFQWAWTPDPSKPYWPKWENITGQKTVESEGDCLPFTPDDVRDLSPNEKMLDKLRSVRDELEQDANFLIRDTEFNLDKARDWKLLIEAGEFAVGRVTHIESKIADLFAKKISILSLPDDHKFDAVLDILRGYGEVAVEAAFEMYGRKADKFLDVVDIAINSKSWKKDLEDREDLIDQVRGATAALERASDSLDNKISALERKIESTAKKAEKFCIDEIIIEPHSRDDTFVDQYWREWEL